MALTVREYLERGQATSKEIQAATNLGQTAVSRQIRALGNSAIRYRHDGSLRYVMTRNAFGGDDSLPLATVDPHGNTVLIAFVRPLVHGGFYMLINTSAPDWLNSDDPELIRDYLLLILFIGLRRNEAAGLRWDWIDLNHQIMTIPKTKNKDPHTLPLSDFLHEMLETRHTNNNRTKSEYVFPGIGKTGHMVEPKESIAKIRSRCKCLVLSHPFSNISEANTTLHDLRRTFITIAESLGIRDYVLKRLLNHRNGRDVTDQYIITDVDRLRAPMQQITDHILKGVNAKHAPKITRLLDRLDSAAEPGLTTTVILTPEEIERHANMILEMDKRNHSERFKSAQIIPFRIKYRHDI